MFITSDAKHWNTKKYKVKPGFQDRGLFILNFRTSSFFVKQSARYRKKNAAVFKENHERGTLNKNAGLRNFIRPVNTLHKTRISDNYQLFRAVIFVSL